MASTQDLVRRAASGANNMTFEFLIVCRMTGQVDLRRIVVDQLLKALEDNLSDLDEEAVDRMVGIRLCREGEENIGENGQRARHEIVGLTIELPDGIESLDTVIEEFAAASSETPPIYHVVKFEDPQLQDLLGKRAAEIFALEMKLR
jgi:hypothetical protein